MRFSSGRRPRLHHAGRILAITIGLGVGSSAAVHAAEAEPDLLVHYTFDEDPGGTAKDLSAHGNDGEIVHGEYLEQVDGRRGVLRFDGESSFINVGNPDSLHFGGDMTIEMRVRLNRPIEDQWAVLFGEYPPHNFYLTVAGYHTLMLRYSSPSENMILPVSSDVLSDAWAHLAVVVEYPRCRFYHNGELLRDAYMPIEGIHAMQNRPKHIGGSPNGFAPIDLDEFRLYRRALTAEEVAAHARGETIAQPRSAELAVEPRWYEDELTLRFTSKGADVVGHRAELALLADGSGQPIASQTVPLAEALGGIPGMSSPGRYEATAAFPLADLEGRAVKAVARVLGPKGETVSAVERAISLEKPAWVDSPAGHSDAVPAPWTPVEARATGGDAVDVAVWGRRYAFAEAPFPQQIETRGEQILAAPMTLTGQADGKPIAWRDGSVKLKEATDAAATLEQTRQSDSLALRVSTSIEYDGYMIFDCELTAARGVSLDELTLEIPLQSRYAQLCYGDRVLPEHKTPEGERMAISPWYSGAVEGDLAFQFSGNIWLGDNERGLTWQAESDEDWRNAERYKAIEILPRGEATLFRAHLIDVPTKLAAGETLRYRFALLATPIKPMLRDAWDLRIMRTGPYGNDLHYPEWTTAGKPTLEYLADVGVRHLFYNVNDIWPWPMPVHEEFSTALHRFIDAAHDAGLKLYPYVIHQRFPVVVPEFDTHGLHMVNRPLKSYTVPGVPSYPHPRPGPVTGEFGAKEQGTVFMCPRSMALQDAYIHSLAQRIEAFGDDGVYFDGTVHLVPCTNTLHGCGYEAQDGTIHPTYPTFAVRRFMQRVYHVVKQANPQNVIDVHCSWGYNPAGLAYADVLWTGEQWHHLRGKGAEHVPSELTLDKFRTEFMGYQLGVPAEGLSYRLGSTMRMATVSLLHDVPVRLNQGGRSTEEMVGSSEGASGPASSGVVGSEEQVYFHRLTRLWDVRERFGAHEAEKHFYWENQDYVAVSPEGCYSTLLHHRDHGVLAVVSNLTRDAQTVRVRFNLQTLGLTDAAIEAVDIFTGEPVAVSGDGRVSVPLGSEEWTYIWLRRQQ